MPIVLTDAGTDLNAQIAAHVLHGVALRSRSVRGDNDNRDDSVYLDISPAAMRFAGPAEVQTSASIVGQQVPEPFSLTLLHLAL